MDVNPTEEILCLSYIISIRMQYMLQHNFGQMDMDILTQDKFFMNHSFINATMFL